MVGAQCPLHPSSGRPPNGFPSLSLTLSKLKGCNASSPYAPNQNPPPPSSTSPGHHAADDDDVDVPEVRIKYRTLGSPAGSGPRATLVQHTTRPLGPFWLSRTKVPWCTATGGGLWPPAFPSSPRASRPDGTGRTGRNDWSSASGPWILPLTGVEQPLIVPGS